jgi:hypothetical protein
MRRLAVRTYCWAGHAGGQEPRSAGFVRRAIGEQGATESRHHARIGGDHDRAAGRPFEKRSQARIQRASADEEYRTFDRHARHQAGDTGGHGLVHSQRDLVARRE